MFSCTDISEVKMNTLEYYVTHTHPFGSLSGLNKKGSDSKCFKENKRKPRPQCSSECGTEAVCISGDLLPISLFLMTSILLQIKREKKISFFSLFCYWIIIIIICLCGSCIALQVCSCYSRLDLEDVSKS